MVKIKVIENSNNRKAIYYRNIDTKSSKYKGVYLKKWAKNKKWSVKISLKNKLYHIDSYCEEDSAAVAYDLAATRLIGNSCQKNMSDFANLKSHLLSNEQLVKINNRINDILDRISYEPTK